MRFVKKAALRPVPPWAVVDDLALGAVDGMLSDESDQLQETLDAAYREMDRLQPALAAWLGSEVSEREDDLAQSLGYFLIVTVYMAFREAFPTRLGEVNEAELNDARELLAADEELREGDPAEMMESDDVVAMTQPVLLHFVQHHLDQALDQAGEKADLEAFDRVYRAVLIEVIALSHVVAPPEGEASKKEALD
jgi:hypothetical protein